MRIKHAASCPCCGPPVFPCHNVDIPRKNLTIRQYRTWTVAGNACGTSPILEFEQVMHYHDETEPRPGPFFGGANIMPAGVPFWRSASFTYTYYEPIFGSGCIAFYPPEVELLFFPYSIDPTCRATLLTKHPYTGVWSSSDPSCVNISFDPNCSAMTSMSEPPFEAVRNLTLSAGGMPPRLYKLDSFVYE